MAHYTSGILVSQFASFTCGRLTFKFCVMVAVSGRILHLADIALSFSLLCSEDLQINCKNQVMQDSLG